MKLTEILPSVKAGASGCPNCGGVGIVLDEVFANTRTNALSLCVCVKEHCYICSANEKPPFLVFDETQNKMIPCFCHEARIKISNLEKLLERSKIPPKYKYKFLTSIDNNSHVSFLVAHDWARDLVVNWNNNSYWMQKEAGKQGMYLSGGTGSGKTHLACIILNELIFRYGVDCRYAKITVDFLNALKDTYQKDSEYHGQERNIEMEFAEVDVLVIDDFGVQKETEWVNAKLYDLIDRRYEKGRITLLTSNFPLSDLKEKGANRIYSRLCEMIYEIKLDCPDFREKFHLHGPR